MPSSVLTDRLRWAGYKNLSVLKRRCRRSGLDWHVSNWLGMPAGRRDSSDITFETRVLRADAVLPLVFPDGEGKRPSRSLRVMSQAPQHQFQSGLIFRLSDWDWRGKSTDLAAADAGWVSGHWLSQRLDVTVPAALPSRTWRGWLNSVTDLSAVTSHKWLAAVSEDRKCWRAWNISTGPPQAAPPKAAKAPTDAGRHYHRPPRRGREGGRPERKKLDDRPW